MALQLVSYLKTLLPHIEKDQILEDLRLTETELDNIVIPAFRDASTFFAMDKFKSKDNDGINNQIQGLMKSTRSGRQVTFLGEFSARLQLLRQNIPVLQKLINAEIGRDVVTNGVSSKKVVLIRIAEKFSYISRTSLDLLNLVYVNEASAIGSDVREIGLSPAEMAKAKASVKNLAALLSNYGVEVRDFEKSLGKTPDILLSRLDNGEVESMYSDRDFDSLTSPFTVGFTGNPIYHIGIVVAEWQAKRYKAAQEKKTTLSLRLLHLNLQKESKGSNPKIEQEIAYNQQRVAKLDRYLAEVEEDLEIEA